MNILDQARALQALIHEARVAERLNCAAAHADMPEALHIMSKAEAHDQLVRSMMNAILDRR